MMTIDEAIKEAERQISQSQYLRECCSGVYETGLNTVYENKSEMLRILLRHINHQQVEIEQLKATLGEMNTAYDEMHEPYLVEATGQQALQIIDLLAKKDQGLLVELPCKVGDVCFYVGFNGMNDTCYISVEKYEVGMYDCGTVFLNLGEAIQCVISIETIEHLKTDKEILERKKQLKEEVEQVLKEREING